MVNTLRDEQLDPSTIQVPDTEKNSESSESVGGKFRTMDFVNGNAKFSQKVMLFFHPNGIANPEIAKFFTQISQNLNGNEEFDLINNFSKEAKQDYFTEILGKSFLSISSKDQISLQEFNDIAVFYTGITGRNFENDFQDFNFTNIVTGYAAKEPKAEEPKAEEPKTEEPKTEEPKVEEPKAEEPKTKESKETNQKLYRSVDLVKGRLSSKLKAYFHPDGVSEDLNRLFTSIIQDLSNTEPFKIIDNNTDNKRDEFFRILGKTVVTISSRENLSNQEFKDIKSIYKFFTNNDLEATYSNFHFQSILNDNYEANQAQTSVVDDKQDITNPEQPKSVTKSTSTASANSHGEDQYAKQLELGNLKEEQIGVLRSQRIDNIIKGTSQSIEALGVSDLAEFENAVLDLAASQTRKDILALIKQRQPHRGTRRFDSIRTRFNKLPKVAKFAARVGVPLLVGGIAGIMGSPMTGAIAYKLTSSAITSVALRRPAQSLFAKISSSHGSSLHKLSVLEQQASRTNSITGVSKSTSDAMDKVFQSSKVDLQGLIDEHLDNPQYKQAKEKYKKDKTPENFNTLKSLYIEATVKAHQEYLTNLFSEVEKRRKHRTARRILEFTGGAVAAFGLTLLGNKLGSMVAEYFNPTEVQGIMSSNQSSTPSPETPSDTVDSVSDKSPDTNNTTTESVPSKKPEVVTDKPTEGVNTQPNVEQVSSPKAVDKPSVVTEQFSSPDVADNAPDITEPTKPEPTKPEPTLSNTQSITPTPDIVAASGKFQMPYGTIPRAKNLSEFAFGNIVMDSDPGLSQTIQTLLYDSPKTLKWRNYADLIQILKSDPLNSEISNYNLLRDGQTINFSDDAFSYLAKTSGLSKEEISARLTNPEKQDKFYKALSSAVKSKSAFPKWSDIK